MREFEQKNLINQVKERFNNISHLKSTVILNQVNTYYYLNRKSFTNYEKKYEHSLSHHIKGQWPPFTRPAYYLRCTEQRLCLCSYDLYLLWLLVKHDKSLGTPRPALMDEMNFLIEKLKVYNLNIIAEVLKNDMALT